MCCGLGGPRSSELLSLRQSVLPGLSQPYLPDIISEQSEWFGNLATQLPLANAQLAMDATELTARVVDAQNCEYASEAWLTWARECGPQATAALSTLYNEIVPGAFTLPVFTPPALPAGVTAVPAGALQRLRDFIAQIKLQPTYTDVIGQHLRIIGEEDTREHAYPDFNLTQERGDCCQCVKLRFKKYGHKGMVIFCKRGNGTWEMLSIDLASPYMDERELLVAGQPELREYRLQWYDDEGANGEFSPVQTVTVNP